MKAIEFSNKISSLIKEFFTECCETEDLFLKVIKDVEVAFCDDGFELRLALDKCTIYQEYDIVGEDIVLFGTFKD